GWKPDPRGGGFSTAMPGPEKNQPPTRERDNLRIDGAWRMQFAFGQPECASRFHGFANAPSGLPPRRACGATSISFHNLPATRLRRIV
ncbi:MAG TPA: hypothetical protein VF258_10140, partial [Luteolibacter sp.]